MGGGGRRLVSSHTCFLNERGDKGVPQIVDGPGFTWHKGGRQRAFSSMEQTHCNTHCDGEAGGGTVRVGKHGYGSRLGLSLGRYFRLLAGLKQQRCCNGSVNERTSGTIAIATLNALWQ